MPEKGAGGACACSLRVISINDVYLLDNFPSLNTLIKQERTANTVTLLAGDFLSPSLLASLDKGRSMIETMNLTPISHVCFGNHEADHGMDELISRIKVRRIDVVQVFGIFVCTTSFSSRMLFKTVAMHGPFVYSIAVHNRLCLLCVCRSSKECG
jgi:hypothetical protein